MCTARRRLQGVAQPRVPWSIADPASSKPGARPPFKIGILIYPGMDPRDFSVPFAVFSQVPGAKVTLIGKRKMPAGRERPDVHTGVEHSGGARHGCTRHSRRARVHGPDGGRRAALVSAQPRGVGPVSVRHWFGRAALRSGRNSAGAPGGNRSGVKRSVRFFRCSSGRRACGCGRQPDHGGECSGKRSSCGAAGIATWRSLHPRAPVTARPAQLPERARPALYTFRTSTGGAV